MKFVVNTDDPRYCNARFLCKDDNIGFRKGDVVEVDDPVPDHQGDVRARGITTLRDGEVTVGWISLSDLDPVPDEPATETTEATDDPVAHPNHYNSHPSGVEVIEITKHMNFCLGNVVKYVLRCDHKGKAIEDLKKARQYLDIEIAMREAAL